jgi:hypothetical protein
MRVRIPCLLIAALATTGCATMTYTSEKPAALVSDCIANGWRKAPSSGIEVPVSLTRTDDYYFVDVVLVRDFPTFLPIHSIWAKVRPNPPGEAAGSSTEYQRNFQITHETIDQVVKECQ